MSHGALRACKTYAPYLVLALVILAPLLRPGYILTLDAVFVPHLPLPTGLSSNYLWRVLLHVLNFVIPSDVLEKLVFMGIIIGSGMWAHQLVQYLRAQTNKDEPFQVWQPYVGGVLYAVNPFTYDRFMAGQYGVLLGYMLLPLAGRLLLEFSARPEKRSMLKVTGVALLLSILSLPMLGMFALLAACAIITGAWRLGHDSRQALRRLAAYSLLGLGLFLLLSCYWLVPLLAGKGNTAQQIQGFTAAHTAAFATAGGSFIGRVFAVLCLQGFWAESHQLFKLPQGVLPGWGTIRLLIWALVVTGMVSMWRVSRLLGLFFGMVLVLSVLLAAGAGGQVLTHVGYREPQKFAALTALAFAVFAAYGAAAVYGRALKKRSALWQSLVPVCVAVVALLFTPTMYWGFSGQLSSRHYPDGWFAIDRYLRSQKGGGQTVFLPWHQYMSFGFTGRIIASPGGAFFPHTIVSNDPELGAITPPKDAAATRIGQVLRPSAPHAAAATLLKNYNVRYILLAKDYDYEQYDYLQRTPGLRLVRDNSSIALYENQTWKGEK